MVPSEVESFVRKFQQLWKDGFTAHLDLDTHAGKAWVGLRVQLENSFSKPVGNARQRRRDRRAAARAAENADKNDANKENAVEMTGDIGEIENTNVDTENVETENVSLEDVIEKANAAEESTLPADVSEMEDIDGKADQVKPITEVENTDTVVVISNVPSVSPESQTIVKLLSL